MWWGDDSVWKGRSINGVGGKQWGRDEDMQLGQPVVEVHQTSRSPGQSPLCLPTRMFPPGLASWKWAAEQINRWTVPTLGTLTPSHVRTERHVCVWHLFMRRLCALNLCRETSKYPQQARCVQWNNVNQLFLFLFVKWFFSFLGCETNGCKRMNSLNLLLK